MFSFVCNHVCGLRSVHRKLEVSQGSRGETVHIHRTIHRVSYIVRCFVETVAIKTFCMCSINNARPGLGFLLDLDDFDIPLTDMHRRKPPRAGSCLFSLPTKRSLSWEAEGERQKKMHTDVVYWISIYADFVRRVKRTHVKCKYE